MYQKNLFLFSY